MYKSQFKAVTNSGMGAGHVAGLLYVTHEECLENLGLYGYFTQMMLPRAKVSPHFQDSYLTSVLFITMLLINHSI